MYMKREAEILKREAEILKRAKDRIVVEYKHVPGLGTV